jgi:hypothetical protein
MDGKVEAEPALVKAEHSMLASGAAFDYSAPASPDRRRWHMGIRISCFVVLFALYILVQPAVATSAVPEIDPSMAIGGLTLVTGSVLALIEYLRRR